jgi:hypothetical protein
LFDITQNDPDGDNIPYWTETNIYHTDPTVDDTGSDKDGDGVPIEWEHKWGNLLWRNWTNHHSFKWEFWFFFNPNKAEDHAHMDLDNDGLNNIEEYNVSEWGSDPFRQDIYVEVDQMEAGPNGEPASYLGEGAMNMMRDAFDKHNIVIHFDDGCMGGGNWIPFEEKMVRDDLIPLYQEHFLDNGTSTWKRGVFHYGIVVYWANYSGYVFGTNDSYWGAFQISSKRVDDKHLFPGQKRRDTAYASVYMHELGHTLDIYIPGGHDRKTYAPWQPNWWKWRPYRSCMNYGYTYLLVDYSDGSRGKNDHNDWDNLDLKAFQGIYTD